MKTAISTIIGAILIMSQVSVAHAAKKNPNDSKGEAKGLAEGSYLGTSYIKGKEEKDGTHMMIRKVPGSDKSFFILLIKGKGYNRTHVSLYKAEPFNVGDYGLTPLEITGAGLIGIINPDPSLRLMVTKDANNKTIMRIVVNNSGNTGGLQQYVEFNGKRSNSQWLSPEVARISGQYRNDKADLALEIFEYDTNEDRGSSVFTSSDVNGSYEVSENRPGMFVLRSDTLFASGQQVAKMPSFIGVMVKNCSWSCENQFILVRTTDFTKPAIYQVK